MSASLQESRRGNPKGIVSLSPGSASRGAVGRRAYPGEPCEKGLNPESGWMIPPPPAPPLSTPNHLLSTFLQGTQTYRTDLAFRAVSAWMRGLGWGTRKTNHALRAYAGSQIAMKYGIYDAQVWLRHSSVTVTEGHYHQYVADFKPANQDDIPARWATLERPELQLRVLPQLA